MIRYACGRLLSAVPVLVAVATLGFAIVEFAPGDAVEAWLGERAVPPEVRASLERAYGLHQPPWQRYASWLASLARGELGWSFSRSRPVREVLAGALPATLWLAGAAMLIHLASGIAAGLIGARFRRRWPDHLIQALVLTLYGMPVFWLGLMATLALAYRIPLFPPSSMFSVGMREAALLPRLADLLWHVTLPAAVLGLASTAATARLLRGGLLQVLGEEFLRAARARGAGPLRLWLVHALRHASIPVVHLLGMSLPVLVSGSLVVEVVFAWPGMGRLAYEALLARDTPLVLAATVLSAILVVVGNLLADVATAGLDPRVRVRRR